MRYHLYASLTEDNNHSTAALAAATDALLEGLGSERVLAPIVADLAAIKEAHVAAGYLEPELLDRRTEAMERLYRALPHAIAAEVRGAL